MNTQLAFTGFSETREEPTWLWQPFLARGLVSLLTSQWKTGKTTLVSLLLQRMAAGGTLAGAAVAPARALVVSEESTALWAHRHSRLHLGDNVRLCCRPFTSRPSPADWVDLLDQAAREPVDLVVIDPLSIFLPGDVENNATLFLEALQPLHRLTDRGQAVLLLHHPRKGKRVGELSPRGSGVLQSFADVLIELDRPPHAPFATRRRRLRVMSRRTSPHEQLLELSADGLDYVSPLDGAGPDSFAIGWPSLAKLLRTEDDSLTRNDILARWPEGSSKPSAATLYRWLERARAESLLHRHGTGHRSEPFRFGLSLEPRTESSE